MHSMFILISLALSFTLSKDPLMRVLNVAPYKRVHAPLSYALWQAERLLKTKEVFLSVARQAVL